LNKDKTLLVRRTGKIFISFFDYFQITVFLLGKKDGFWIHFANKMNKELNYFRLQPKDL